ncbi:hypothetical protein ACR77J_04625 [Tissierella praeacuta]|uniref:hypothetical protein n=1 Tax=Tissierella praeacuta TaxID=43131 RepID=UPI003DA4AB30
MKNYDLMRIKSNGTAEFVKNNMKEKLDDLLKGSLDGSLDDPDVYRQLHSIIPIFDEYNDIEEIYVIIKDDEPKYDVIIKTKDEEKKLRYTKNSLDIILKSNTLIYDDKEYKINNIITDISSSYPEIIIECE